MTRVWEHRTGVKGRQRREEVLETAAELFTRRGYESTTTQDIAEAIGCTKGSLYYYVESKEELLFRVLLRNHEELHRHVVQDFDWTTSEMLETVGTFIARHVHFVLTHRAVSSLYADEARVVRSVQPWWEALVSERRKHEHFLLGLIEDAQASGAAAPDSDPTLTTRALLAIANSPLRWFHSDGPDQPDAIAAHHAELARRSLRPA